MRGSGKLYGYASTPLSPTLSPTQAGGKGVIPYTHDYCQSPMRISFCSCMITVVDFACVFRFRSDTDETATVIRCAGINDTSIQLHAIGCTICCRETVYGFVW